MPPFALADIMPRIIRVETQVSRTREEAEVEN
jgi:hypothetical protein